MRRYPEDENTPIEFVKLKKIIVESEDDKKELLEAFEYLHNFCVEDRMGDYIGLDNDNIAVNLLMHLYLNPETIEVEQKQVSNQIELLEVEKSVLKILGDMVGENLYSTDKNKYLKKDLRIDALDFVETIMKIEIQLNVAIDDCVDTEEDVTIEEFIKNVHKNLIFTSGR